MAYFLFIDESGQDHRDSPYEVLAGVAIEDRDLWNLVTEINQLEEDYFGTRYNSVPKGREIKARKFLNTRTFKQASKNHTFSPQERQLLAKSCLEHADKATIKEISALSQAKIEYAEEMLKICLRFRCKIFGSIVKNYYGGSSSFLRKDYVYLFERFYYFLQDKQYDPSGIVVFDELDKSQSHILINQMDSYFQKTEKGKLRSDLIIPEPFFVHSDLSTGIKVADLVAYILSWGFRTKGLDKPARPELKKFVDIIKRMRYRTVRDIDDGKEGYEIWSIVPVDLK